MAIEDFSFALGKYTPQYAGIPLDQIQRTADVLSTRHYQNIAQANQLEILANQMKSKLLPGARSYVDDHINSIDTALQDMAAQGGENSTARVQALARKLQGDESLLRGLQRADEYNRQTALIDELKARKEIPLYDTIRREELLNAPINSELYTSPYAAEVEPFRSPTPEMEAIWQEINPDAYESAIRAATGTSAIELLKGDPGTVEANLPLFFETITKSGISGEKIKGMLENAWSSYKNSSSFQQQTGKLVGKSQEQLKNEFLRHGLLRVYQNIARDYKQTPAWMGRGSGTSTDFTPMVHNPLPATVRSGIEKGLTWDTSNITPNGIMSSAGGFGEGVKAGQELSSLRVGAPTEQEALDKHRTVRSTTNEEKTGEMLSMMRTAMDVAGVPRNGATDKDILEFANTQQGKEILDGYMKNVAGKRYHMPFISNYVSEQDRKAGEDFLRGNVSQRAIIDMRSGKYYRNLKDEDGHVENDLKELSKALTENKVILEGPVDPKHVLTEVNNADESFVRGLRIQVPDEKGDMHEYLIGQLPGTTSPVEVNTNVLYRAATTVPGRWGNAGNNIEVLEPASQYQKDQLWAQYSLDNNWGISKQQYDQAPIILIKVGDRVVPAASYETAAQYLSEGMGLNLKFK